MAILWLYSIGSAYSQQWFSNSPISSDSLVFGNLCWGDYDQDGDQDLLAMGAIVSGDQKTVLYNNQGGSFTEVSTPFVNAQNGTCEFFDFDNDNDLDVIISGFSSSPTSGAVTRTYENVDGTYQEVFLGIQNAFFTSIKFFDLDKDGDDDLLLTGWIDGANPGKVQFYENQLDTFLLDTNITFPPLTFGSVDATDLDHDGNIDLVIAGSDSNWVGYTGFFEYNPATHSFESHSQPLLAISDSWVKFVDFNDDGFDDLFLYGLDQMYNQRLLIYKNDGTTLNEYQTLDSLSSSTAKNPVITGDIDNDGDIDILVGGSNDNYDYLTLAYINVSDSFELAPQVGLPEWGSNTTLAFCDVDQDFDLDFAFTGRDNATIDEVAVTLFENLSTVTNTPPAAPATVSQVVQDSSVVISWSRAIDNETRQLGLTYNFGLYYTTGSKWIVAPKSLPSGERMITADGNMLQDTTITFEDLDLGIYEWRIQSIDNSYIPSEFEIRTFEITEVVVDPSLGLQEQEQTSLVCSPVPFTNTIRFENVSSKPVQGISIYNALGEVMHQMDELTDVITLETATWAKGVYFVSFVFEDELQHAKIMKQ